MAHEQGPVGEPDPVVAQLRRSHVFGILGLLVGLALGIALGVTAFDDSDATTLQLPAGVTASGQAAAPPETVDVSTEGRPAQGPSDAKVTVVEFLDFQCPFCQAFFDRTLPRIRARYGDRIRFVARDFPLDDIHPRARRAAYAAECAFAEGRYWEFHDLLFQSKDSLDLPSLRLHATEVGIDRATFDACMRSPEPRRAVRADVRDGREYGVTGTPTFFINGHRLEGAYPFRRFAAEIEKELG